MSALSDYIDYKAAAVMASMKPILTDLIEKGKKLIYIVSDLPSSQYWNKKMFWLTSHFAMEYEIALGWIYSESGHGTGIPDGIGTVVKNVIKM